MKKLQTFLTIIILVISTIATASTEIKWFSLKKGIEKSKAEKKPMIIDFFYGKGCPRCEVLEKTVYQNPLITRKIMDDFIPIRVDLTQKLTEDEEQLGKQYDFKNDCLLLFLDHNGNVIKDQSGKRFCFVETIDAEWFVKYLDMIRANYKK